MKVVYEASKDDIAMAAGGPMGSPIETIWTKLFSTLPKAKAACQADYSAARLVWKRGKKCTSSQDLGVYQYTITQIRVL